MNEKNVINRKKVARAEAYYFDDNNKTVPKEEATRCIIREYDENGKFINEIFGYIGHNNNRPLKPLPIENNKEDNIEKLVF